MGRGPAGPMWTGLGLVIAVMILGMRAQDRVVDYPTKEVISNCNQTVTLSGPVILTINSSRQNHVICDVIFRANPANGSAWKFDINWVTAKVGVIRHDNGTIEKTGEGMQLLDSDGRTPLILGAELYALLRETIRSENASVCANMGISAPCLYISTFSSEGGSDRSMKTSGATFTVQFKGIPQRNSLRLVVVPVKDPVGNLCDHAEACYNGGGCVVGRPYIQCICSPGYYGRYCITDVNECERYQPCHTETSQCINYNGSYACACDEEYRKDMWGRCVPYHDIRLLAACGKASVLVEGVSVLTLGSDSHSHTSCTLALHTYPHGYLSIKVVKLYVGVHKDCWMYSAKCDKQLQQDGLEILEKNGTSLFVNFTTFYGIHGYNQRIDDVMECQAHNMTAPCDIPLQVSPEGFTHGVNMTSRGESLTFTYRGIPNKDKLRIIIRPYFPMGTNGSASWRLSHPTLVYQLFLSFLFILLHHVCVLQ